jgi:hypothetical protein
MRQAVARTLNKTKGLKHNAVLHNIGINWVGRGGWCNRGKCPSKNLVYQKLFLANDLKRGKYKIEIFSKQLFGWFEDRKE